ncbi:hypothetical protein M405DRAFT_870438 [Rhizopogon salebrosus TDB-379]|nr:hypothetical protein M405DRAFT_870438 [Rhizopogon salebrosus TDB-379]
MAFRRHPLATVHFRHCSPLLLRLVQARYAFSIGRQQSLYALLRCLRHLDYAFSIGMKQSYALLQGKKQNYALLQGACGTLIMPSA